MVTEHTETNICMLYFKDRMAKNGELYGKKKKYIIKFYIKSIVQLEIVI